MCALAGDITTSLKDASINGHIEGRCLLSRRHQALLYGAGCVGCTLPAMAIYRFTVFGPSSPGMRPACA
jgi:hypothetical protein